MTSLSLFTFMHWRGGITISFLYLSPSDKELLKEDLRNVETNLKAIENMLSTIEFHNEIID